MASTFAELIAAGWHWVHELEIEGVRHVLPEVAPKRAVGGTMALPTHCVGPVPALICDAEQDTSQEIDRDGGVARGDEVVFTLSWEALTDAGTLAELFKEPALRVAITADIAGTDTDITVESTAGVTAGDYLNLGRELMQVVTVTDATHIEVTRAVLGYAYAYRADSPTYRWLTDTPEVWRGRFTVLHRHLVSPEGRALDATWRTGTYHREEWAGFIDEAPRVGTWGMELRCLPLVRLAAQEVGYEMAAELVTPASDDAGDIGAMPIVVRPGAALTLRGSYTGSSSGTFSVSGPTVDTAYVTTVNGWAAQVQDALATALAGEPWWDGLIEVGTASAVTGRSWADPPVGQLVVRLSYDGGSYDVKGVTLTVEATPLLYWLTPGTLEGKKGLHNEPIWHWSEGWPAVQFRYPLGAYLPVVQTEGEGWQDLVIPESGLGLVEVDGALEIVRWDDVASAGGGVVLLRLAERGLGGTGPIDIAAGATLRIVTGAVGTPGSVALRILESTGTGLRGTYDTLGLGHGLGVPSARIDEAAFAAADLTEFSAALISDGRASLEGLVGGWLALSGWCLVQRRNVSGVIQLTLVRVEPEAGTSGIDELAAADIELSGVGTPRVLARPNQVKISRSGPAGTRAPMVVRDETRIQQETTRSWDVDCPGIPEGWANQLAATVIAIGRGQSVVDFAVAPANSTQIGDLLNLVAGHPTTYNWATATRAPASIVARVVGERGTLATGRRRLQMLLAGLAPTGLYLCPSFIVEDVSDTTTIRIGVDPRGWLTVGDDIRLWTAGDAGTEMVTRTVTALGSTAIGVSAAWPAWVVVGTLVTFGDLADMSVRAATSFLYQASSRRWGG